MSTNFNPFVVLKHQRVDSQGGPIRAVQSANDWNKTEGEYSKMLAELSNGTCAGFSGDYKRTKSTYLYLVQNLVTQGEANVDITNLTTKSIEQADKLIASGQVYYNGPDAAGTSSFTNQTSSKKRSGRKGDKQIKAKEIYLANKNKDRLEIIKMFMTQLDMSKAGATTYYYSCKKALS